MMITRSVRSASRATLVLAFLACAAAPTFAAGPKVIGTVTFAGRPGLENVAIVGFTWNATNGLSTSGGGGTAAKVAFDAFRIVKIVDATSPALLDLTFGGTTVTSVRVDVAVRRGVTASYVLTDAVVNANARRAGEGNGPPLQEIALAASSVRETIVTPGGTVTSCFDVKNVTTCH